MTGDGVPSWMGTAVAEAPREEVPPGYPEPAQAIPGETADELFNRLILPEMEVMWRVALSITRNAADAEDVVQESLLRAYRAIETFDGRYPRRPGCSQSFAIPNGIDIAGVVRSFCSHPEIAEERGPATESDAVERYAEDREFDDAVARSLLKLPENFRQIIELVDIDGLSYQEAADLLDVPLGTVMSRLHCARRRIRDMLIRSVTAPIAWPQLVDTPTAAATTQAAPTNLRIANNPVPGVPTHQAMNHEQRSLWSQPH